MKPERKKEILDAIAAHRERTGNDPTIRELADALKKKPDTVRGHVVEMVRARELRAPLLSGPSDAVVDALPKVEKLVEEGRRAKESNRLFRIRFRARRFAHPICAAGAVKHLTGKKLSEIDFRTLDMWEEATRPKPAPAPAAGAPKKRRK